ncbi:hypothetical protein LR48_Vigan09g051800 [Vigna angularis]|uniref:Kinesin motor domain-containing protein n=1 Tax=Phaseolus angularis TaxID=3914 RepID=A0A0L9VB29_PHAAN|nr:hypothetical protein LR48_Vigan09g051800 [Vigna angularis]
MSMRHEKEKGVNVQVLLRCRPFSDEELRSNAPQVVTCNDYSREVAVSQSIAGKHIDRVFTFDKVFGPSARQKDLYEQAVTPIVNEVLEGFNCTIFAYGQTGTGKTYTMEGECKRAKSGPNGELPPEAGVIPRAVKQIFDTLEGQNAEYSVKVTFLELYNEEITDLLAPEEISKVSLEEKQKKQLPLMEDGFDKRGVKSTDSCSEEMFDTMMNRARDGRSRPIVAEKRGSRREVTEGSRRELIEGWRGKVTVVDEGFMKRARQRRGFESEDSLENSSRRKKKRISKELFPSPETLQQPFTLSEHETKDMANNQNGRRTLTDYATITGPLHFNSIARPRVNAISKEMKPTLIHLVHSH